MKLPRRGIENHTALPFAISACLHLTLSLFLSIGLKNKASPQSSIVTVDLVGEASNVAKGSTHSTLPEKKREKVEIPDHQKTISKLDQSKKNVESPENTQDATTTSNNAEAGSVSEETLASGTTLQLYISHVVRRLDEVKIYPEDSIYREEQGRVVLLVEISPDGKVLNKSIIEPSSFDRLNKAAIDTIAHIGKLPPLPEGFSRPLRLHIPLNFELSKR